MTTMIAPLTVRCCVAVATTALLLTGLPAAGAGPIANQNAPASLKLDQVDSAKTRPRALAQNSQFNPKELSIDKAKTPQPRAGANESRIQPLKSGSDPAALKRDMQSERAGVKGATVMINAIGQKGSDANAAGIKGTQSDQGQRESPKAGVKGGNAVKWDLSELDAIRAKPGASSGNPPKKP